MEFQGINIKTLINQNIEGFISLTILAAKSSEGLEPSCLAKFSFMNTFIHQNGRLADGDNICNRLRTYYMQSLLVTRE